MKGGRIPETCASPRIGAPWRRAIPAAFGLGLARAGAALAGMPSITLADLQGQVREAGQAGLTELARQRIEVISAFLLGLILCAWVIRRVWEGLRKDFPALPKMSYARALGVITLWGLLFLLVLTMVSGARELLTPGAWEKTGLTYTLAKPPKSEAEIAARVQKLEQVRQVLFNEPGGEHERNFPDPDSVRNSDDPLWRLPPPSNDRYVYLGGRRPGPDLERMSLSEVVPVAHEPASVGPDRLVLLNTGLIVWKPEALLETSQPKEARP